MGLHQIKKGLDLPISGAPAMTIDEAAKPRKVALAAADYIGMKPTFLVQEGDAVQCGQQLFEDKKTPGVFYTAPAAGTLAAINRGDKRALQSVVIDVADTQGHVTFDAYSGKEVAELGEDDVRSLMIESGMWTALRTRPYSKVPAPETKPTSIFVTAIDSNPLAPCMDTIAAGREEELSVGLKALTKLTDGAVFFCKKAGSKITANVAGVRVEEFEGPHPSGLVGLHIHLLDPVHREKTVWHIGLQDVLAMGALFTTGKLDVSRVVALAGPEVNKPRLLRTQLGASIDELVDGELKDGDLRVISGSVLSGRAAMGEIHGYLGRYHQQISVLREDREQEFLGWMAPGANRFSVIPLFISKLLGTKEFDFSTSTHGDVRAIVPIMLYEKVMPMDILPSYLLRSLMAGDLERSEQLGCLELDEEDLALCTFVCPGKNDYGTVLRNNLTTIEKEG